MGSRMKVGTLVKVNEQHASRGDTGVIVKRAGNYVQVYWDKSDLTYWIEVEYLEVIYEQARI